MSDGCRRVFLSPSVASERPTSSPGVYHFRYCFSNALSPRIEAVLNRPLLLDASPPLRSRTCLSIIVWISYTTVEDNRTRIAQQVNEIFLVRKCSFCVFVCDNLSCCLCFGYAALGKKKQKLCCSPHCSFLAQFFAHVWSQTIARVVPQVFFNSWFSTHITHVQCWIRC